ncbi:nucleoid-structuring protein H-NS [Campylobacter sp. MIT 21-1685]|uniref:nucleoid-structuring protein H-NS n=1 Tax=unclassified Campylobacter TaxID=2593542 RepID=UPI00224AE945|nr:MULTISPECIES: nucleoid-structuring protein H-NS [unclassified Campylobacter]MCX2682968.1 nucleoid-structuring protein H-NS [Campylobacter sp. MIT 21-1684]MCX2751250.1 nucleoid-structuring protein H-NS [Campylobacter sp. MIT 21-1682]MCX2807449.1 nucleoid-structuring protein H-NS [Campylobacter sp. MIT 21-1685]
MGFQQSFQEASKHNGTKYTQNYSIPTLSLGFTYSLTDRSALSISGASSSSSSAPNSVVSLSLWRKF